MTDADQTVMWFLREAERRAVDVVTMLKQLVRENEAYLAGAVENALAPDTHSRDWGEPGTQEWERRRFRDALEAVLDACRHGSPFPDDAAVVRQVHAVALEALRGAP